MYTRIFNIIIITLYSLLIISCKEKLAEHTEQIKNPDNVLQWSEFGSYIKDFNENDEELYVQYYPNSKAEEVLKENIPYFQCPDKELEKTYYFRWWTFRKHIKKTPAGFVITEFLPDVSWAGRYNTIDCPAGHHFYEGRWLHNQEYLQDYANFWFKGGGSPRSYSFWAANSMLAFASVHQNKALVTGLLPYFDENYKAWEESNKCEDGMFWQADNRDGMEVSIGGSGKRATINSYMIGDAKAIARIAKLGGNTELMNTYSKKAEKLTNLMLSTLWDKEDDFFKTMPLNTEEIEKIKQNRYLETFMKYAGDPVKLVDVRELHGYTPWYFSIPEEKHSVAWKFLLTKDGFNAPFGPTTAEQCHPDFKVVYEGHACQWNGPGWPYATSITLKAMANLLRDYDQHIISKSDYVELLQTYSNSHRRINEKGKMVCWIDENLNPFTGDWMARTILKARGKKPEERGKDYNHSAFCDFIISDLVGIRPSMDNTLTINPLVPEDYWDWFCLDRVKYHDNIITVIWDRDGTKYRKGKGFSVFVNGEKRENLATIEPLKIKI